ncbi:SpoIIE family protein phosphatase [Streptomyces sp. NPDC059582]|uniref:SpoIIE family protein phosphatase n=1 Tax=Streptomyces sp. NPDC059582 TaxID=3346875 RepID=UPI00368747D1
MPTGEVLLLVDEGGRVAEWGRAAQERFGWSAAQAVGQSLSALVKDGGRRRAGLSDPATLAVRPVVQGDCVLWQVFATGEAPASWDAAVLEALFTHAPQEVWVLDGHLRVVRANALAGRRGTPAGHGSGDPPTEPGKPFTEMCGFADPGREGAVARGVLEGGEPVVNRLVRGASAPAGSGRRLYSVSYFPLEGPGGEVVGLVVSAADVTEQERARTGLALLESVRDRMGHRLNVMDVCQELVEAVVPAFAATAVVEVVESVLRGEEPPLVPVHPGTPLRRAAVQGRRPVPPDGTVRPLPSGTPFSPVLSDLQPRLVRVGSDSGWLAADPVRAVLVEKGRDRSLIVAPLVVGEQALGLVTFCRDADEEPFVEEDLTVASAMCAHAALCLDRASRYMREWIVMSTVQRRLFPGPPADHPTVQTASLYIPGAGGGGTWSDAIALPGARTALVVGDVAGEGMPAAITMGLLRTAVHTLTALDLQPDELLARLSDTTARLVAARAALPPLDPLAREPLTADCAVAVYDPVELTCTVARAGLPEPVMVLPDGTSSTLPVPAGPALAETDTAPFPAVTVRLPPGSTLAIGTPALADAVLAPSGPLRPVLDEAGARPLPELRDRLEQAYGQAGDGGETVMLLARTRALPAEQVLTCVLPAGAEAAPIARKTARRRLQAWGMDEDTAFAAELIVSELVGNATRYGVPPLRLRLILDRMLTCEVSDAALSAPQVRHARTVDESGRGLFIVASLAEQWGTRYTAEGKIVWAEQPTGESSAA